MNKEPKNADSISAISQQTAAAAYINVFPFNTCFPSPLTTSLTSQQGVPEWQVILEELGAEVL